MTVHDWYTDVLEEDCFEYDVPYYPGYSFVTFWGHRVWETEFLDIMTICLSCGHSVIGCACDD